MGASCFWNIDRQGRRHTARSRKSLGLGCLSPKDVPQIRNEHGSSYVMCYGHDEAGNLVYLSMAGYMTVLRSVRATV